MKHVVVVGSGIAGLVTALELGSRIDVTLVTKAGLSESNTRYAQGGIAAAMTREDSAQEHMDDTLRAGAGLCDREAVRVLCTEGPERIRGLMALGVPFDYKHGELAQGLEAAHTRARVLHAGGDATGLTIETALVRAVRNMPSVRVLEHTFACDAVLRAGVVTGLEVLLQDGARQTLAADAVVLASGGAGQLFAHTTNPEVATGDGVALALRAGAILADLEFYQFHPTLLAAPGKPFLISEAVRGEGAVLLDDNGRRFMQALHPGAELAPRDVVARGIALQMAAQQGRPVRLDATALGAAFLEERFPTIDAVCRERGLDWAREPIPVTPAAHYWMGGVRTDTFGRTNVPGLLAVGEVACTGVHGANRLASNSLLESLVFAWRCAQALLAADSASFKPASAVEIAPWPAPVSAGTSLVDRAAIQALIWKDAGIARDRVGLAEAAGLLQGYRVEGSDRAALEDANLLTLARGLCAAALAREESRGAHWRRDHPETRPELAHSYLLSEEPAPSLRTEAAAWA